MCCHTTPIRSAVHAALAAVDPALAPGYRFWHQTGAGRVRGSDHTVAASLDAAWMAATLNSPTYDAMMPDEQLAALTAFVDARKAAIEDGTPAMTAALDRYTASKVKEAERSDGQGRRWTRRSLMTLGATLLLTAGFMAGSTNPSESEAASRNPVVYTAPTKGQCLDGARKVILAKGKTVQWKTATGKVAAKKLAKKTTACVVPAHSATVPSSGGLTVNASGAVTALPVGFPASPTVAQIAVLGLTADSKVSPSLRIPQPAQPVAPAKLADTVRPVRAYPVQVPRYIDKGLYDGGLVQDGTDTVVMVEWELRGGSGVVDLGNGTKVPFVDGVAHATTSLGTPDFAGGQMSGRIIAAGVAPDFGQAGLPASTTQGWHYRYAKDATGIGSPVGVHANSAIVAPDQDGSVWINSDYSLAR